MYVRSNTLLLTDVFENFRKMCFEIDERDPVRFITGQELAWQASIKNTKVKLDLLPYTIFFFLLMVEKGITGGTCHDIC